MLIDTHTHVNFNAFKEDGPDVIDRALQKDIWMINVGSQLTTSKRAVNIASDYKQGVYASIGLHPIHLQEMHVDEFEVPFDTKREEFNQTTYHGLAQDPKVVAIGETGLDYYHMPQDVDPEEVKKKQEDVFRQQLALAKELNKPVVVHSRGSETDPNGVYQNIISILKEFPGLKGIIHCFGGDFKTAEQFLEQGHYISFTGIITFKNAKDLHAVVKEVPLEKILIETDAPYLTPEPYRGKRNEPVYVRFVAEKIAELKEITFEEVAETTTKTAKELFKIS